MCQSWESTCPPTNHICAHMSREGETAWISMGGVSYTVATICNTCGKCSYLPAWRTSSVQHAVRSEQLFDRDLRRELERHAVAAAAVILVAQHVHGRPVRLDVDHLHLVAVRAGDDEWQLSGHHSSSLVGEVASNLRQ